MAQMVHEEVVLGVQVNWKTVSSSWRGNVLLYWLCRFVVTNPLALLENPPTPTIIPPICKAWPKVLPKPTIFTPPFFFQLAPPMPFVPESITLNTYPRSFSCDEWSNCLVPLGTKCPSITIEHAQPHGWKTIGFCGSNGILYAIWHDRRSRGVGTGY